MKKMLRDLVLLSAFAGGFGSMAAAAPLMYQTFDTSPTLSATQSSGAWYTDRYAPDTFDSVSFLGDNRLALGLAEADGAGNRTTQTGAFYDTQGRKYDTPGAMSFTLDMYIDPAWATLPLDQRVGGVWGTASGSTSGLLYPILEFINGEFSVYDTAGSGDFVGVGTQSGFAYGEFANLGVALDTGADTFTYSVNGEVLGTFAAGGATMLDNIIVQGVNRPAETRTMHFDNLKTYGPTPVPLPASLPLLVVALGVMGFGLRKRAA